ncbi:MAG: FecR domain-containing protein [Spirochaetia bacterium]
MRPIQTLALVCALLTVPSLSLFTQSAEVTYLEGFPELKAAGGSRYELDFGDVIDVGESVITGATDYAELEQGQSNTIRIEENTVFTIRQVERGGETRTVLSNTAGAVSYRFDQVTGREPEIGTSSAAAGVRGTELTVYAGDDGTSLFAVDSGLVDVESGGETVSLSENEAVEVAAGRPPGEKFEWLGRELDFSSWNQDRLDAFLEDPIEGLARVERRLDYFAEQVEETYAAFEKERAEADRIRDEIREMQEEGASQEDIQTFRRKELTPITDRADVLGLNFRYYALSALSMRRFVVGKLYMQIKSRYILDEDDPIYSEFLRIYNGILADYEENIVPRLVDADI